MMCLSETFLVTYATARRAGKRPVTQGSSYCRMCLLFQLIARIIPPLTTGITSHCLPSYCLRIRRLQRLEVLLVLPIVLTVIFLPSLMISEDVFSLSLRFLRLACPCTLVRPHTVYTDYVTNALFCAVTLPAKARNSFDYATLVTCSGYFLKHVTISFYLQRIIKSRYAQVGDITSPLALRRLVSVVTSRQ